MNFEFVTVDIHNWRDFWLNNNLFSKQSDTSVVCYLIRLFVFVDRTNILFKQSINIFLKQSKNI